MIPTKMPLVQNMGGRSERSDDVASILQVVASLETAQWNRDAAGFMQLLAPKIVWVTAFGRLIIGWDEVDEFTKKVLTPSLGNSFALYKPIVITFLDEQVAAVNVGQDPVDADGLPLKGEAEGRPLYIMTKIEGSWRIAAAQNTRLQSDLIALQARAIEGE